MTRNTKIFLLGTGVAVAVGTLLRLLFPKDEKTLAILKNSFHKAKKAIKSKKAKKKNNTVSND